MADVKKIEKFNFVEILLADMISDKSSWIQIMKTGAFKHSMYGDFKITNEDLSKFEKSFSENVRGIDIAIDVEHDSEKGAVGWFKKLETRVIDGGKKALFAFVEWTQEGVDLIKGGKFKYMSPDFTFKWKDEFGKTFDNVLMGGALTNRPFLKNMQPVVLSESVIRELKENLTVESELSSDGNSQAREKNGQGKQTQKKSEGVKKMSELSDKVKAIIETADISDEDLTAKVKDALGVEEKKDDEPKIDAETQTQLSELKGTNVSLTKKVDALTMELNEGKANVAVDSAISAKKIVPAQKEWAKAYALSDPKGFAKFVETAVEQFSTEEKGSGAGGAGNEGKEVKLSETEISLAKQLGVSEFDALNAKRARMGLSKIEKKA